ncbi:hypothetical protein EIK77_000032 [Talaromyces pinophilus]|nr:hypothetical protein EIK77_000032 [Talaromyces pinophilus]
MSTSDLLAELDLIASIAYQSEMKIELPKGYLSKTEGPVMFHYLAQIHLRKLLNQIHQSLYDTKIEHLSDEIVSAFGVNLDIWKQHLPDSMQWQEGDEPSDDINTARLRAKYYGARYIIYRPILERALHSESLHYDELDDETRRACEKCITAAIQSTKAFNNIQGRPIVTNIFGYGHA